jgi:diaminohydroxyphosphoribosylaminopyrimidine deaminase/5-amino-6-(5-phosphoribosylamino)uracil reductase
LSLIRAEVKEVVAAMQDPNPVVAGKGLKALRESGISTVCGVLKEKAGELNRAYVKHVTTGLPLVVLKAGMSLDGKISTAGGESRWITGEVARRYVHRLRSTMDAVMVGTETLLRDDPRLTARPPRGKGRDPLRVVVDSKLRLPLTARIFDPRSEAGVVIATTGTADGPKAEKLKATPGVTLLELDGPDGRVDLPSLMKHLGAMGVTSLMLEGGAEINASMLEAGLVDKVMLFMSNMIIGGRSAPGVVGGGGTALLSQSVRLQDMKLKRYGQDLLVEGDIA